MEVAALFLFPGCVLVSDERNVDTGGGSAIGGNVQTGGGEFSGRDRNEPKSTGNVVNVYPAPEKPPRRRRVQKASGMSATVEHELRRIVAQAEIRIDDMQAVVRRNERVTEDAFEDLRREMRKLREATRPLDGQGILAAAQQSTIDEAAVKRLEEHNQTIIGLVKTGIIVLGIGVTIVVVVVLILVLRPMFIGV
jgi:hypothetical protein